jgi:hypothetical protein
MNGSRAQNERTSDESIRRRGEWRNSEPLSRHDQRERGTRTGIGKGRNWTTRSRQGLIEGGGRRGGLCTFPHSLERVETRESLSLA